MAIAPSPGAESHSDPYLQAHASYLETEGLADAAEAQLRATNAVWVGKAGNLATLMVRRRTLAEAYPEADPRDNAIYDEVFRRSSDILFQAMVLADSSWQAFVQGRSNAGMLGFFKSGELAGLRSKNAYLPRALKQCLAEAVNVKDLDHDGLRDLVDAQLEILLAQSEIQPDRAQEIALQFELFSSKYFPVAARLEA